MKAANYDVIVIGGGPAGATTAAVLAGKGRRVLVLEKAKFPRYHIGESLMPFCYFTLERLGLVEELNRIGFQKKLSVQFVTMDGRKSDPFYFFQHYDHPSSTTWQVTRSEFDQLLWDRAAELGAEMRDETRVLDVLTDDRGAVVGVRAQHAGEPEESIYHAAVTVDATGRDALVAGKRKWRTRDPVLNKIAIWTYFRGAKRDAGIDAGSTTVAYLPNKGWFWNIPLQDDIVSVGIVAERDYLYREGRDPAEIFEREIENNRWIHDHLESAEQFGEYWVTGEFSYRAKHCAADGLVLVGDAFAFLDPVFSSGVFLALKSGEMAADAIDAALEAGDCRAARFECYGSRLCNAIETMRKIVYAFYDENFSFAKLVRAHPGLRPDLTDVLIGNVEKEKGFDELFEALGEFADLPEELDYGRTGGSLACPLKA